MPVKQDIGLHFHLQMLDKREINIWYAAKQFGSTAAHQLLLLLQPFSGPLSGTTRVSRYQKGKTNLDLLQQEAVVAMA